MEKEISNGVVVIIIVGLTFLVTATMALFLSEFRDSIEPTLTSSEINFTLTTLSTTLSPIEEGITSATVQTLANGSYLDFDGDNDYVLIESYDIVISFWYKNLTSDWIHIVNNSGTTYVNGALGSPVQYPVYFNGSNYYFGKTNATTFFEGSIDEVRIYDNNLTTEEISLLYLLNR